MSKRLLMVIPFFPPMAGGGVYRPLSFVKHLGKYGWSMSVVAQRGDAFWIRDEKLVEQIPPDCRVLRTPTLSGQGVLSRLRGSRAAAQRRSSGRFGLLRRLSSALLVPDSYLGWYPYAVRAGRKLLDVERFDAIYSTSPPETSHLVASTLARHSGLPWVADFRDPWMNLHLFSPPTALHSGIHRRLERRVCTRAHVVVATRWHEEWIRKVYPGSPGVTRIPNGFEGAEVASVAELRPPQDRLTITHAGMLTQKRSAAPFLLGLKMFLSAVPEARRALVVTFVGPREDRNERAVEELGLAGIVQFRDSLPHEETLRLEKQSHILLLIKHLDPVYRGMVPGKMYEYIGLRRPILALVPPGEAAEQISVLRRGEVVSQSDDKAIARVLGGFYESFRDGSLDENYDLSARPEFDRERLAGDLARLLDRVTGGGRN